MTEEKLTVDRLICGGFQEVGCWEVNDAHDLTHANIFPNEPGVYAFAIDGIVQYVGLASRSLRQRLGFYRKPGASQATNIRLNKFIRAQLGKNVIVQILIAHPTDHEWNGFKVNGAEGLEAGLIATFDLPWNMRGRVAVRPNKAKRLSNQRRKSGVAQRIVDLVERRPGMTELELAKAIYGPAALQPQVNAVCRKLIAAGQIERRGQGGIDTFIYYPLTRRRD